MIKKLALTLSVVFIILTFIGAGYVLLNNGKVNAGYACVPSEDVKGEDIKKLLGALVK